MHGGVQDGFHDLHHAFADLHQGAFDVMDLHQGAFDVMDLHHAAIDSLQAVDFGMVTDLHDLIDPSIFF
jgi:hypothetical protein